MTARAVGSLLMLFVVIPLNVALFGASVRFFFLLITGGL